jgi:protein TonB
VGRAGVDGVIEPKRLAESAVRPQFTTMAGLGPVEAAVLLSAIVRADGTVGGVRLIELTGGPAGVVEPAIAAVRQWRYRPATRDGHPIDARITVLVDFRASS